MISYFQDKRGQWRFRIRGNNAEIIVSSQAYASMANAKRAVGDLTKIVMAQGKAASGD